MADKLVIVESPAKAKTIQKYLGAGYRVTASMGHVRDLPKSKIGVDIDHDFAPAYEVTKDKEKIIAELKRQVKAADEIYLATDPDREGEAIAWHILQALNIGKRKPVHRVTFNQITPAAVREAIANPRTIDSNLVDAQQARRVLDRLVGYKLSPLLWDKVRRGLSAGRVQSVAVRMIVEREREIEAFVPQEYWTIEADLFTQNISKPRKADLFRAVLVARNAKKLDKFAIASKEAADAIIADLDGARYVVASVARKDKRRTPAPPFITSTLQQEASRKLGFSAKRTMQVAQKLYEGIDIGGKDGAVGLITYMRTDSTNVSPEAQAEARKVIEAQYGKEYLPASPPVYTKKAKGAQEAHEAIRPTSAARLPDLIRAKLGRDEARLYDLVWKRFMASQMAPAVFDSTSVDIAAGRQLADPKKAPYTFRATGSVLKFPGFLAVYNVGLDEGEEDEDKEALLPPLNENQPLSLHELLGLQHWTTPPPRYTEASLVKDLEKLGIGRPSTYAPTISTIVNREYVELVDKKLLPTTLGGIVTDLLVTHFSDIVDYNFTSDLEQRLDDIAEGERRWVPVMKEFYGPFEQRVRAAGSEMRDVKREEIKTALACPESGDPLVIKFGRNGEFLACSHYPDCGWTGDLERDSEGGLHIASSPEIEGDTSCPECGKPMALKKGRFGPFLACSGYPGCKGIRKVRLDGNRIIVVPPPRPTKEKCPKCGKPMVQKESKYGPFLSCTGYPTCRTIVRITPEDAPPCPECGQGKIAPRRGKAGKMFYSCSRYPDCKYASNTPPLPVAELA
ncbi:MAG TPA: type I DNA topoisomerase [Herpetosiphonaceae bacterium]